MPGRPTRKRKTPARLSDASSPTAETSKKVRHQPPAARDAEGPPLPQESFQEQLTSLRQDLASLRDVFVSAVQPSSPDVCSHAVANQQALPSQPAATTTSAAVAPGEHNIHISIGELVDPKLKAKIWSKEFFNLELLLSDPQESFSLTFTKDQVAPQVRSSDKPTRKISSISQWTDAFLIYMAIYLEVHPAEATSMLKYMQTIRNMAQAFQGWGWKSYDIDFRKFRAQHETPWHVQLTELYIKAAIPVRQPFRYQRGGAPPFQSPRFKPGSCYQFQVDGRCRRQDCPYKHFCGRCTGQHPAARCPNPSPSTTQKGKPQDSNKLAHPHPRK